MRNSIMRIKRCLRLPYDGYSRALVFSSFITLLLLFYVQLSRDFARSTNRRDAVATTALVPHDVEIESIYSAPKHASFELPGFSSTNNATARGDSWANRLFTTRLVVVYVHCTEDNGDQGIALAAFDWIILEKCNDTIFPSQNRVHLPVEFTDFLNSGPISMLSSLKKSGSSAASSRRRRTYSIINTPNVGDEVFAYAAVFYALHTAAAATAEGDEQTALPHRMLCFHGRLARHALWVGGAADGRELREGAGLDCRRGAADGGTVVHRSHAEAEAVWRAAEPAVLREVASHARELSAADAYADLARAPYAPLTDNYILCTARGCPLNQHAQWIEMLFRFVAGEQRFTLEEARALFGFFSNAQFFLSRAAVTQYARSGWGLVLSACFAPFNERACANYRSLPPHRQYGNMDNMDYIRRVAASDNGTFHALFEASARLPRPRMSSGGDTMPYPCSYKIAYGMERLWSLLWTCQTRFPRFEKYEDWFAWSGNCVYDRGENQTGFRVCNSDLVKAHGLLV